MHANRVNSRTSFAHSSECERACVQGACWARDADTLTASRRQLNQRQLSICISNNDQHESRISKNAQNSHVSPLISTRRSRNFTSQIVEHNFDPLPFQVHRPLRARNSIHPHALMDDVLLTTCLAVFFICSCVIPSGAD